MIELTAAQAAAAIKSGDLDAAEYFDFYRARAAADAFNSYIWVADETPEQNTDSPFAGVPIAIKDLFCTEGVPSQAGSKILEGYRPPYTATSVRNLKAARRHAAGQDQPGRVRDGLLHRELRLRPDAEPVGHRRASPAAPAAAARPASPPAPRRGRSAPTPAARSASPPRCAGSSGMKPTYGAISRYGMIAFASSLDQAGTFTRDVTDTRAAAERDGRRGPVRQHQHRPARAGQAARPRPT